MRRRAGILAALLTITGLSSFGAGSASATTPSDQLVETCEALYGSTFGTPNSEPLAACQWDMALIDAGPEAWQNATGKGVTVGVIGHGLDLEHPDVVPNLDLDLSCSFLTDETPMVEPDEITNGDCSNKAALDDGLGLATHVATTIAGPVNGVGIAGVAPEATLVALKACGVSGYCFPSEISAALRYAGDQGIDIVNMSLYVDPYLFYCKNDKTQKELVDELASAARYAQAKGVTIVSAAIRGQDLQHPGIDRESPNYPPDSGQDRDVTNNCLSIPSELPQSLTVSGTGPVGYPGYDTNIASYSGVGMSRINVTAPGGDFFTATGTTQDGIIAGLPTDSVIYSIFDGLDAQNPGTTTNDAGAGYGYLYGTSMATAHVSGVAALVVQRHPNWSPGAVKAAIERTATPMSCPQNWAPVDENDQREKCYGQGGRTSFFGMGMVNALAASRV